MRSLLAALVLAAACAPRAYEPTPTDARPIAATAIFLTAYEWDGSPWARPADDLIFPRFVVIAHDGSACIVPANVWALSPTRHACATAWRLARP